MQYPLKYQAKKVMTFQVLKVIPRCFRGSFYDSSNNVNYVVSSVMFAERQAGPDIAGKTEFVTVKKV